MTADASSLILHQYEISPFSEKVRVALGIKGLAWYACDQPVIMPKPELLRLTGGYRRIPVLQIGADLYFDSLFIIEELERRFPSPTAFISGKGVTEIFSRWSDQDFFMTVVGALFGDDWNYDDAFIKDRSELLGRKFDPAEMIAASTRLIPELRRQLGIIETQLADGRAFLMGAAPDVLDATIYCQTIFMRWGKGKTAAVLNEFPHICAWERRVAAIGHGARGAELSREEAIIIARDAAPAPVAPSDLPGDDGLAPGEHIRVKFHDANSPPLDGVLRRADRRSITLRPLQSEVNEIHIHLPRSVGLISRLV